MIKRFWPLLTVVTIVVLAAIILPATAGLMPHIILKTDINRFTVLILDSPSINIPDDVKEGEPFKISGRLSYVDEKYDQQIAILMENEVIESGRWVSAEKLFSLIPAEALIPLPSRQITVSTEYGTTKNYYDTQTAFTDVDGYFMATVQIDDISQWHKWIEASYKGETGWAIIDGSTHTVIYIPSSDYIPEDGPVRVPEVKDTPVRGGLSNVSIISVVSYSFAGIFVAIVAYFIYSYRKKLRFWLKRRKAKVMVPEPVSTETVLVSTETVREVSTGDPRVEILFPQIENSLPPVWGIGEPLTITSRVLIETSENNANAIPAIKTTDSAIDIVAPDFSPVKIEHSFDRKGETDINVYFGGDTGDKMFNTRKIKIVDYREEIVELFNRLIDALSAEGIEVDRKMTAREIESQLKEKYPDLSPDTMKDIVKGFEYANYSLHPVARKIYVYMYLAVGKIRERVKNA